MERSGEGWRMSQLISVSAPSSGREMLERAAMRRRAFFPDHFTVRVRRTIAPRIVYDEPVEISRPPAIDLAAEAAAIIALVGRRVRVIDVICATAEHFGIRKIDLISERRTKAITIPRQVVMYLSRELTSRSLQEIGQLLGGKDHSTIIHGCRNVEKWTAQGLPILADVDAIRTRLLA